MKRCLECNIYQPDSAQYCYYCGKDLVRINECECGEPLLSFQKYCPACGRELETVEKKEAKNV